MLPAEKPVPPLHEDSKGPDLPRVLGALSAASILIGCIIGSGIFRKPSVVAAGLASPGWIIACWAAAGVLSLIGSLVFAELGSAYPGAGGQYTYIRESFGKLPAFLFGWTNLLIINSASIAALAVISSTSFLHLFPVGLQPPQGSHWYWTLPVLLIAGLTAANAAGIRWGAGIQNLLTVLKLAALGLIITGAFLPAKGSWANLTPFWEIRGSPPADAIWNGFKGAFLAIFWAYDGWYLLSFSGGEIRNPRRNIPIGFVLGILVVIGVYVAANISYFRVISLEDMQIIARHEAEGGDTSARLMVGEEAAWRLYGGLGLALVSIGIVCSTLGAANGNILTGPRLSFAMARDGLFFRRFGGVHARYLTPFFAIVAQGVLAVALVFAGSFDQLTDSVVFAAWIFYLLTVIGYFRLRKRYRRTPGVFFAPGHPVLPALFIGFAAVFIIWSSVESFSKTFQYLAGSTERAAADGLYPVIALAIMLAGVPVYWVFAHTRRIREKGERGG